jgi:hypothetical protein
MAKSKFFRIAVAGQTTDGRTIEPNWLDEMAASYNPDTYGARVNMEHIRGFSAEPPFNAYGDVLALKADDVSIDVAGKTEKRRALFAQIDATDDLVALNKQRQKLFTSCEIAPNFAGTGKAYLVGLAVTDSPASLGTEMLTFAAGQGDKSPLASRKQKPENLFSSADDVELELELEPAEADKPVTEGGLKAFAAELVARFKGTAPVETPATPPAPEPTPPAPANDNGEQLAAMFAELAGKVEGAIATATAPIAELSTRVDTLAASIEQTPANAPRRPIATGTDGFSRTDC